MNRSHDEDDDWYPAVRRTHCGKKLVLHSARMTRWHYAGDVLRASPRLHDLLREKLSQLEVGHCGLALVLQKSAHFGNGWKAPHATLTM